MSKKMIVALFESARVNLLGEIMQICAEGLEADICLSLHQFHFLIRQQSGFVHRGLTHGDGEAVV